MTTAARRLSRKIHQAKLNHFDFGNFLPRGRNLEEEDGRSSEKEKSMPIFPKIPLSAAAVGFAFLTSVATFLPAHPAFAMPGQGVISGLLKEMPVFELAQRRVVRPGITARRAAVTTRRVYRRTARRAVVAGAVPAAVVGQSAGWTGLGWPFRWGQTGLFTPGMYGAPAARYAHWRAVRVGGWLRPRNYWWQPGGAIAAGAAFAAWPASSASLWVGAAPAANLCWYRTTPFIWRNGFWDVCQPTGV